MIKDIIKLLEKKWGALIVCWVVLIGLNLFKPTLWKYIFAILLAYLLADGVKSLIIRGEDGAVSIRLLGHTIQHKGHNYIAFFVSVITGTVLSGFLTELLINYIATFTGFGYTLISNAIIILLVYLDFSITFYKRS